MCFVNINTTVYTMNNFTKINQINNSPRKVSCSPALILNFLLTLPQSECHTQRSTSRRTELSEFELIREYLLSQVPQLQSWQATQSQITSASPEAMKRNQAWQTTSRRLGISLMGMVSCNWGVMEPEAGAGTPTLAFFTKTTYSLQQYNTK